VLLTSMHWDSGETVWYFYHHTDAMTLIRRGGASGQLLDVQMIHILSSTGSPGLAVCVVFFPPWHLPTSRT
jgi:hypothetical protein